MTLCHRRRTIPAGTIAQKVEMMKSHALPQLLWGKRETVEVSSTGLSRSATKDTNRPTHATVHRYHASSCRDNLQQPVAPRRQGPWVPPLHALGVFGHPSLVCNTHVVLRVPLGHEWQLGRSLFGLPARVRVVPFVTRSVLGSTPLSTFHHCTGQVATDPQSPKGGSQRACPQGVPTPRLLGVTQEWRCFSSRLCLAARKRSLWVASPGVLSQPPFPPDRFLGRRPSVLGYSLTAWMRGWHGPLSHRVHSKSRCRPCSRHTALV